MSDQYITKLLGTLGWGSGFRLPIASTENRELENFLEFQHTKLERSQDPLEKRQRRSLELRTKAEEESRYTQNLKSELGRVSDRLSSSSKILSTVYGTVEHAKNLTALAERGFEHSKRDLKLKTKELNRLRELNSKCRHGVHTRKAGIDELSSVLKWDQSALEELKKASTDKENDIDFMAKYLEIDKQMASDTEVKYQTLGEKVRKSTLELDATVNQTQQLEQQYERICRQFRRVHRERNQSVQFWKNVLDTLKLRDKDTRVIAMEYINFRGQITTVEQAGVRKQDILDSILRTTQDTQAQLGREERQISETKLSLASLKMRLQSKTDEGKNLRTIISQTGLAIKQHERRRLELEQGMKLIYEQGVRLGEEVERLRKRFHETKYGASSAEERLSQMREMLDEEDVHDTQVRRGLEKAKKCLFQAHDGHADLKRQHSNIDFDMRSISIEFRKLRKTCKDQDFELAVQKEKVYKLDLQVLTVKNKLHDALHPIDLGPLDPRYTMSNLHMSREILRTTLRTKALLMNQKGHMDDVIRRLRKEVRVPEQEKAALQKHRKHVETLKNLTDKEEIKLHETLQNIKFDNSMEKLRLHRLQRVSKNRRSKISNLEQHRALMKAAVNERRTEIHSYMTVLEQQRKLMMDAKVKLGTHVADVTAHIKLWTTKYDIIMCTMHGSSEESLKDGTQARSEAYFILKQANERELMKREGGIWDRRVKEAERELIGLQNTLAVMANANQAFRESLAPVLKGSEDHELRKKLEETKQVAIIRTRQARKNAGRLTQENGEKEQEIKQLELAVQFLISTAQDRKFELDSLHLEIANQKSKLQRASLATRRMVKQLEHTSITEKQLLEAEIKLRCTKEKYSFSLKSLDRALAQHPILKSSTIQYLRQEPRMFSRLVQRIEKQDYTGTVYNSPLESGAGTPKSTGRPDHDHSARHPHTKELKLGVVGHTER